MAKSKDLSEWLRLNEKVEKEEQKLFLTEAEVRSFPKYKDATDEEVRNIINTLHKLALICYEAFCKEERAEEAKNSDLTLKK